MLVLRYSLLFLPLMLVAGKLNAMDDPAENFLNNTCMAHKELIKATQEGATTIVMGLIHKNPSLRDSLDKDGNTLLTIAFLNKRNKLVKKLIQAGARTNILEYTHLWGLLSQTPQTPEAQCTLSLLEFTCSKPFILYDLLLKKMIASASTLTSYPIAPQELGLADKFLGYLRGTAFNTFIDHAARARHYSAVQSILHTVLCAAAFDNNYTCVSLTLEKVYPICSSFIRSYVASIATRECNNHFLALYILFSSNGALKDIFFKQLRDAQAHN